MNAKELIDILDIGNSVAEFDKGLQKYFIETQIYKDFISDRFDIIAGDKGTGKSAIYHIVKDRYKSVPTLQDTEIVPGFNEQGSPVFQKLTYGTPLDEGQYITIWKSFILSTVGNWVLDIVEGETRSEQLEQLSRLDKLLQALGLRSQERSPENIFSIIANFLKRVSSPKSIELGMGLTGEGWPIVNPKIEFSEPDTSHANGIQIVYNERALAILNDILKAYSFKVWFVLDRLDEAFAGTPAVEIPALRALLRTYLDFNAFDHIKIKLFLRKDLFRRVTQNGFVNLSHVNARKVEISWSDDDLKSILCSRIKDNAIFIEKLSAKGLGNDELFGRLVPSQVDVGDKKPPTWRWILNRIQDGNHIKPPRNLIDLINKAREVQARREERDQRDWDVSQPLFEPDSLRRALAEVSALRVNDTLLAESGSLQIQIEKFRNGKAEQNIDSLSQIIKAIDATELHRIIKDLVDIGFLEIIGNTYKIPMLYRLGLNITQGKAFSVAVDETPEEELE